MDSPFPRVAVVLVSYHSEPYIQDVISSFKKSTYPKDRITIVIVDNPHPQFGSSMRFLQEHILPLGGEELPQIILLPQETNTGFTGGCNAGIAWAKDQGFDYAFLHNQDGFLATNALERIVSAVNADHTIGAAQCLLLLHPDTHLVNSAGNAFHYLGMGYCQAFRTPKSALRLEPVTDVGYASGAALLVRMDLIRRYGALDDQFFLYHEDTSYSLRMRILGYRTVVVRDAEFYHKYQFSRHQLKFFYIERNRFGMMLMYFRWRTLLLLLPMYLLLEIGILLYASREGWLGTKFRVYGYWLQPRHWKIWLQKRAWVQSIRTVSDRELLSPAVGSVVFEEKSINTPLLTSFGNPLMEAYWRSVKRLITW